MSLRWEIKASPEIVCEDREKVNKLFPEAEQTEGCRNRLRDSRPRALLIVHMTSQEYRLLLYFLKALRFLA